MVDIEAMNFPEIVPSTEPVRLGQQIRTLAAVHDVLTHSQLGEETGLVSVKRILDPPLPLLTHVAKHPRITYSADDALLATRRASALGFVTNELASKSVKHARNEIAILFEFDGAKATMTVSDDVPGFPAGYGPEKAANTGLELVNGLAA